MPNPNKTTELYYYDILKNEIEQTFGKKISASKDCLLLSEDLFTKISVKVNSNTLRRFFGIVKTNYMPSSAIIEILCRYCGFASFEEFTDLKTITPVVAEKDYYSISILNYLVTIFKHTITSKIDNTFTAMVKYTIQFLQRHTELYDKFHRTISKTKNGQQFYFEKFIDIDGLNSFYGTGLRYYLLENNSLEAQVFGHSLLCIKDWLSDNSAGVKKHHDELVQYHHLKELPPAISGHLFATQLLYANIYGLTIEKITASAQQAHVDITRKAAGDAVYIPYFEWIVSTALLLTGHPKGALYYINHSRNTYPGDIEPGFRQSMDIIKALAYAKAGKLPEAAILYRSIHPSQFYFLSKKTDTILYLFLSQYLNKDKADLQEQLNGLITTTGFTRLHLLKSTNASIESLQFFTLTNSFIET